MYFYSLYFDRDDDYEGSSVESLYCSNAKLENGKFTEICKEIFDKNAKQTLSRSYIDLNTTNVDWDLELAKHGLFPFVINAEELFSVEIVGGYNDEDNCYEE